MKRFVISMLALLAVAAFAGAAQAQTNGSVSDQFQVTADVQNTCTLQQPPNILFGSYDPISNTANTAGGSVSVTCVNGIAYSVELDGGLFDPATSGCAANERAMSNGATTPSYLCYNITKDSDGTFWGSGTDALTATGTGNSQVHNMTATIPAGQTSAELGNYSDTVTVTVLF